MREHEANEAWHKFVDAHQYAFEQRFFLVLLVSGAILGAFVLFLSHRLAGPLVRLKGHLKDISEGGKRGPIHFRENDFFTDLPPLLNAALRKQQEEEYRKKAS